MQYSIWGLGTYLSSCSATCLLCYSLIIHNRMSVCRALPTMYSRLLRSGQTQLTHLLDCLFTPWLGCSAAQPHPVCLSAQLLLENNCIQGWYHPCSLPWHIPVQLLSYLFALLLTHHSQQNVCVQGVANYVQQTSQIWSDPIDSLA